MLDGGGAGTGQGAGNNTGGGGGAAGGQGPAGGSYTVNNGGPGGNGGGQGAAPAAAGGGAGSDRERRSEGAGVIVERLLHRYGSAERALEVLAGDNFDLRETNRTVSDQLASTRANLPPNGAVVLVGDDVGTWNTVKALNLPADKIKERVTEYERLSAEQNRTQLGTLAQQAAAAVGYSSADVLGELLTTKGLQIEMRDATVPKQGGGTEVKRMPFVRKTAEPSSHFQPLAEYMQANHAMYLPALTAKPAGGQGAAPGTTSAAPTTAAPAATGQGPAAAGVVFMQTPAGDQSGGGGAADPVAARIAANKARAEAPNPLRPAKPAGT